MFRELNDFWNVTLLIMFSTVVVPAFSSSIQSSFLLLYCIDVMVFTEELLVFAGWAPAVGMHSKPCTLDAPEYFPYI